MPSFDIVSEVDMHELSNAVDQASREVSTRFDLKGTAARFEQSQEEITYHADSDFQIGQLLDILQNKLVKRGIDIACLENGDIEPTGKEVKQTSTIKQGLEGNTAKKIVKDIKAEKLKVQSAIQGDKVRVTGKKRDDLQTVIAFLRDKKYDLPLQFNNFRD